MPLPLEGLTVLDFSTLLPGPLATLMLAEAGAEVVKVERPGGEDMRRFPPVLGHCSAPFAALNGSKKSIIVDLKTEEGIRSLDPLIRRADILVEQFRPGVMARLGLGYASAAALNPRLIYCSITGYGQEGPRAQEAGHDINYQAVTGLLSLSPAVPASLTADIAGGAMPAVMNILLALRHRDQTGEGCHLDIAMADAMFTFGWYGLAQGRATGQFPGPHENMLAGGSPRYALYETADGQFLAVGALEQKFWDDFCDGIGLDASFRDDRRDSKATKAAVAHLIREKDAQIWQDCLGSRDCCCTVLASLEDAATDEHFKGRGLFDYLVQQGTDTILPMATLPIAPTFRPTPTRTRPVPEPGEHTQAVLGPRSVRSASQRA